jgi:hypothetical protein
MLWSLFFLILPLILILLFDPASTRSRWNIVTSIADTLFFIDLPIGMCLLHYNFPQLFYKNRRISLIPWVILFFGSWSYIALSMYLSIQLGHGPDNGFAAVCAYLFGWMYICFTMIPIGLIYLLFRLFQKLWKKRTEL